MDNGFYALYLYICRKRDGNIAREGHEVCACKELQRQHPQVSARIESYCARKWDLAGVLSLEQVHWDVVEPQRRFPVNIEVLSRFNLGSPGELPKVIKAHKRLLTVLANWAASERVWAATSCASTAAFTEGYVLIRAGRTRYAEMHTAVITATKE